MSEVRKYDKIILSDAKSKDEIVAEVLEEINKKEQSDVDGNLYICYVIHAYESGDNAAANYIVVSDNFRTRNGLYSNVIKPFQYTKPEIDALVAEVDNKLPIDPVKKEKEDKAKELEADIVSKEQSIVQKEKELVTLKEEKTTLENRIEAITRVIQEKQAAGEDVDVLEAEKRQYERELATAQSQINTLESELGSLKDEIEVLEQTKDNLEQEASSINTPEMATKVYVDEIKASLDSDIATKANQDTTYTKTEVDDIANTKANQATTYTKTEVDAIANTKANQATTYTKTEVDDIANTKANANATVNLTGNQTIAGIKTFSSPPVSATQPTANNQVANKAYVDSAASLNKSSPNYKGRISIPVGTTRYTAPSDGFLIVSATDLDIKADGNTFMPFTLSINSIVLGAYMGLTASGRNFHFSAPLKKGDVVNGLVPLGHYGTGNIIKTFIPYQ